MELDFIAQSLIAAIAIMAISLSGLLFFVGSFRFWAERNLHYLASFAAGVFLVVAIDLTTESFEMIGNTPLALGIIAGGAFLVFTLLKWIPEGHHHHSPDEEEPHTRANARAILWGDGIHNIADGVLLPAVFLVGPELAIPLVIGIIVHEFVQEVSEFFVLREAGYTTAQALIRNFLISATVLIGVVLGVFLVGTENIVGPILGLAAGAFFYVVFWDLLPRTITRSQETKRYSSYALAAILGVLVMLSVNIFTGHGHPEEDHQHHQPGDEHVEHIPHGTHSDETENHENGH